MIVSLRIFSLWALIAATSAAAETPEVNRVTPVNDSVCRMSQQIIIIKCVRATTIVCEEPGAPVSFQCAGGVAEPSATNGASSKSLIRTSRAGGLASRTSRPFVVSRHHHTHKQPKPPLQSLFDLFRVNPTH